MPQWCILHQLNRGEARSPDWVRRFSEQIRAILLFPGLDRRLRGRDSLPLDGIRGLYGRLSWGREGRATWLRRK